MPKNEPEQKRSLASVEAEGKNVLEMLMSGSNRSKRQRQKEQRANTGTRFVLCPVGCGHHVLEKNINVHIDECLVAQRQTEHDVETKAAAFTSLNENETHKSTATEIRDSKSTPERQSPSNEEASVMVTCEKGESVVSAFNSVSQESLPKTPSKSSNTKDNNISEPIVVKEVKEQVEISVKLRKLEASPYQKPEKQTATVKVSSANMIETNQARLTDSSTDAFARMMAQSKTAFAKPVKIVHHQTCHLNSDGTVSLYFHQGTQQETVAWSTLLTVKDRAGDTADKKSRQTELEVTLSSSLPNKPESNTRLVRRHSRLSVPVLKSILQKSIRRRRPLPAVRVAMELADKSLGDLLRRLPVIILEDSSLHPDMGLLVWLMMAHSKGYQIPFSLLTRLMEIVFEVASCQWIDQLVPSSKEDDGSETSELSTVCTLSLLADTIATDPDKSVGADCLLLWSLLVRAEYGGMKFDVRMLRSYASTWMQRFRSKEDIHSQVSEDVKNLIQQQTDGKGTRVPAWSQIAGCIHKRAHEQARLRVTPLCVSGLDCLSLNDVTWQGVDFHCSNIIDHLLSSDPSFVDLCLDLLGKRPEGGNNDQHSWLVNILKRCMWDYSAGVNRRRPLLSCSDGKAATETDNYKEFWEQLVLSKVTAYQKSYLEHRLVN